jgi:hypothetical protein
VQCVCGIPEDAVVFGLGERIVPSHGHDQIIPSREVVLESPKRVAQSTLDPVADHRIADLPGDGQPDASLAFAGKSVNQEGPAADGVALIVDPLELGRSQQASMPGKQVPSAGLLPHGQSRSSSAW